MDLVVTIRARFFKSLGPEEGQKHAAELLFKLETNKIQHLPLLL
jgi:hypothetical protein